MDMEQVFVGKVGRGREEDGDLEAFLVPAPAATISVNVSLAHGIGDDRGRSLYWMMMLSRQGVRYLRREE